MSKRSVRLALLVVVVIAAAPLSVRGVKAAQEQDALSPSYRFEESVIGGGGLIQSNSANYQTNGLVLGDTAVGESSSDNFTFGAGNKTTPDPTLTVKLLDSSVDFGNFSSALPSTATAAFSVINYTSSGYSVFVTGAPPSNNGHTLPAMSSPTNDISSVGTEQFGMNLVANTSPLSVGQNLQYGPFGKNGNIDDAYNDPGSFRFQNGHRIAYGSSSSGETTYTISYLVNVSSLTPGGAYKSDQALIVTGTF